MSLIKYRVHEVAKDFGVSNKEIAEILTKYATKPATHQKVLEDDELTVIFEYMTQRNQVESIESIFADVYHEPKPAAKETPKAAAPAAKEAPKAQPAAPAQNHAPKADAQKPAAHTQQNQQVQNRPTTRGPEK